MLKFPQGKFIEEAMCMVESIEEQEAWLKASKKNNSRSYRFFLTKFPRGNFMQPASLLLELQSFRNGGATRHPVVPRFRGYFSDYAY